MTFNSIHAFAYPTLNKTLLISTNFHSKASKNVLSCRSYFMIMCILLLLQIATCPAFSWRPACCHAALREALQSSSTGSSNQQETVLFIHSMKAKTSLDCRTSASEAGRHCSATRSPQETPHSC